MTLDDLIDKQTHPEDIAIILGRHPVAIRRLLPKNYNPGPRLESPYGLGDATIELRVQLGGIIAEMSEKGISRSDIGEITGLNTRESCRAEKRPFNHDWTLSQIERTLKYGQFRGPSVSILESNAEDEA